MSKLALQQCDDRLPDADNPENPLWMPRGQPPALFPSSIEGFRRTDGVELPEPHFPNSAARLAIRQAGSLIWVARIKRSNSESLIIDVWAPFRKSSYSRAIAGDTTSIISRFSSQNSIT